MDKILQSILKTLGEISVSGLDVERMYIVKSQLRQLQTTLTAATNAKKEAENGNHQDNVPIPG